MTTFFDMLTIAKSFGAFFLLPMSLNARDFVYKMASVRWGKDNWYQNCINKQLVIATASQVYIYYNSKDLANPNMCILKTNFSLEKPSPVLPCDHCASGPGRCHQPFSKWKVHSDASKACLLFHWFCLPLPVFPGVKWSKDARLLW